MKKTMKLVATLTLMSLVGCAKPVLFDPLGNCRNRAIYCAMEARENYETKVASGPVPGYHGINHAQAKAKINGEWQWLTMMGANCYAAQKDNFEPLNDWKVDDFIHYIMSFKTDKVSTVDNN